MRRTFKASVLILLAVGTFSACGVENGGRSGGGTDGSKGVGADPHRLEVTKDDFGKAWPFTVPDGELACKESSVTFSANGRNYGLNGTAQDQLDLLR
jgi:hypothetical protein